MADKTEEFKQRLAAVLEDLRTDGVEDGEAMYMLGSLGKQMLDAGAAPNWGALKGKMSAEAYQSLLNTMQARGNALVAEGKGKAAYALQALAISLVARTQPDPTIRQGEHLLDGVIEAAIAQFRQQQN